MVNDSLSPIPQVDEKKKRYTAHDLKRTDRARWLQNIIGQPIKRILNAVDDSVMQNLPILREDVGTYGSIYGTSVPHLQDKTVLHKIEHAEPVMLIIVLKEILEKYNKITLCCDLIHINIIGFLNTISQHTMFDTRIIIKNLKIKNIEYGIKEVHKIYLQRDFKSTHIHAGSDFEPLCTEMSDLGISLNCLSKKEIFPDIEQSNQTVK